MNTQPTRLSNYLRAAAALALLTGVMATRVRADADCTYCSSSFECTPVDQSHPDGHTGECTPTATGCSWGLGEDCKAS